MGYLLLSLLLIFPSLASAQELHTFSNGEVADAEKINDNFQYVIENATGSAGCSAEQDGSSVVITCADGTSGVLASEGTVVALSGGVFGDGVGGAIRKEDTDILEMWNEVIAEMSADGTTAEITKKWFGRDISM